jgi:hypothetical protein
MVAEGISAETIGVGFWALSTLAGGVAYAWARLAHRKTQPTPDWLWVALALLGVVAVGSIRRVDALIYRGGHPSGPVDAHYRDRVLLEVLQEAIAPMDAAIWTVFALCVLAVVLGAWSSVVRRKSSGSDARVAVGVFALGAVIFTMTRAHHVDARETVLPRLSPPDRCDYMSVDGLPTVDGDAAAEFVEGPLVLVKSGRRRLIDGIPADRQEMRVILENKRERWFQLWPEKDFRGNVVLSITGALPMDDVQPWFDEAQAAGFTNLHALVGVPHESFDSRTLGEFQRAPACVTIKVQADFAPGASWGEHVEAARR